MLKVIKMVLTHDLVEIYAGDTFCYDNEGNEDKKQREELAAEKLFNILPVDQAQEFRKIWDEFEELETPESRFANCLDRLQPLILNYNTQGHTWQRAEVNRVKVLERNAPLKENMPLLWDYVNDIIEDSIERGYLKK